MTDDDTTNRWDPEHDETEWWAGDHAAARGSRRGQRRAVTIVGLFTVVGFGAATVVSTGESEPPASTTPTTSTSVPAANADGN